MQFKVPQFLEIEDKIFGPFTFRQFIYLAGGAGLCFIIYKLLGAYLGLIPILAVGGLSLALMFYRPNNKPFIYMIEAGFNYIRQDKLYVWRRREEKEKKVNEQAEISAGDKREALEHQARLGGNRLRDLAWSLDVLDINKHEKSS